MSLDAFAPDVDIEKELAAEAETPQEAPKEEVKAEVPEQKVETPKEEPKEKYVPYGALHEERQKRKEYQARAEQVERESAERFKKLEERLQKLQNPVPTFEQDPANNLRHEVETLKPVAEEVQALKKQQQQMEAMQAMTRKVTSAEREFAKENPDYLEAVDFLKTAVRRNLMLLGNEEDVDLDAAVNEQAANLAAAAIQRGKNPAQVAYELAKNYGYKAKVKEPDLEKKIETIEKGQKLPSMPSGGRKEQALSLAALEQMDEDEFNKLIDDPVQWKKLISQ